MEVADKYNMDLILAISTEAVSGAAAVASVNGEYDGTIGSSFEYKGINYSAVADPDSEGTVIVVGNPYIFYQGNMVEWKDKL